MSCLTLIEPQSMDLILCDIFLFLNVLMIGNILVIMTIQMKMILIGESNNHFNYP